MMIEKMKTNEMNVSHKSIACHEFLISLNDIKLRERLISLIVDAHMISYKCETIRRIRSHNTVVERTFES
jgi:hypothetical protein